MCQMGKKEIRVIFLTVFCLTVMILGCGGGSAVAGEIPVTGGVNHVQRSDGSQKTYLNIYVGAPFAGELPGAIDSITVTGPNGVLPVDKKDFHYIPQTRVFWTAIPGAPPTGKYTFTLSCGASSGSTTDTQSNVKAIPIPDISNFKPADNDTQSCLMPAFSWPSINDPETLYYRLEIRDMNRTAVYKTEYVRDMFSFRIPPDILDPGCTYQWRVIVADGPDWISLNNLSQSPWVTLSMDRNIKSCHYQYTLPVIFDGSWEISSLEKEGVETGKITEMIEILSNGNMKDIHSVLIVKNGKLVLEEYFYGYTRHDTHYMMSVSKSISSLLIGIAIDQRKIKDIEQKIYEFFPSYQDIGWDDLKKEICLKHVLNMTAGLDWNYWDYPDHDPRSSSQAMIRSDDWIRFVLERDMVAPPGKDFAYSNGLSMLLGEILRNATGEYADTFAEKYLFNPLGISEFRWQKGQGGIMNTAWGLKLRPRDMAKIGYMMLKKGRWNDHQIVSSSWVDKSTKKQSEGDKLLSSGYGFQWWLGSPFVNDKNFELFCAAGKGGQYIMVCPELDLITVFTSKEEEHQLGEIQPQILMANYIIPAMLPSSSPPNPMELDPNILEEYVGEYEYKRLHMPLSILKKDDKLFFKKDQEIGALFAETVTAFFGASEYIGKFHARFHKNDKGEVTHFTLRVGFGIWRFDKIG